MIYHSGLSGAQTVYPSDKATPGQSNPWVRGKLIRQVKIRKVKLRRVKLWRVADNSQWSFYCNKRCCDCVKRGILLAVSCLYKFVDLLFHGITPGRCSLGKRNPESSAPEVKPSEEENMEGEALESCR